MTDLPVPRDLPLLLSARTRQGWARVRASWFPILQAAVGGAVAFAISREWLGHPYPFFAPVATWVALGFSMDRSVRRVAELAVGVAIGVGLGDLVVHVIGSGMWQVAVVLFTAAILSRFIDRGAMLTTQAGVQAIVIVGLPPGVTSGGPFGRWVDALVGGAIALAIALLTPTDSRRHPRTLGRAALEELGAVLRALARGLAARSAADIEESLVRGRASQPALDEWTAIASNARDLARVAPAARRHLDELAELVEISVLADRAMRNARVLSRRALTLVDQDAHDLAGLAACTAAMADAVDELATDVGGGLDPARPRGRLLELAGRLDPFALAPDDWQAQSIVLLQRSLVVDLLEATGVGQEESRAALPAI